MITPRVLRAFTQEEEVKAGNLLAAQVATMFGRKFEEADWQAVYCDAKGIPSSGWSNLNIDVAHKGLGVEQKMLCYRSKPSIREACGQTLMHPSATRAIRIPEDVQDATAAARDVLRQYVELIERRTQFVRDDSGLPDPDMRMGWLLWQESLLDFLYFEEEMHAPDPEAFVAEWVESGGGARRRSRNLWVYEKTTGKKRYSITTSAGAKIQPYFDVPAPGTDGLYVFTVQGKPVDGGMVQIWITGTTGLLLKQLMPGGLGAEDLSQAILASSPIQVGTNEGASGSGTTAIPVKVTEEAYQYLCVTYPGVSDEHRIQLFAQTSADLP